MVAEDPNVTYFVQYSCARRDDDCMLHQYDVRVINTGRAIESEEWGVLEVALTESIDDIEWVTRLDPNAIKGKKVAQNLKYRVDFSNMARKAEFGFVISSPGVLASHPLLTYANLPFGGNCPEGVQYPIRECSNVRIDEGSR